MQNPAKVLYKYKGKTKIFLDILGLEAVQPTDFSYKTNTKVYSGKTENKYKRGKCWLKVPIINKAVKLIVVLSVNTCYFYKPWLKTTTN